MLGSGIPGAPPRNWNGLSEGVSLRNQTTTTQPLAFAANANAMLAARSDEPRDEDFS